MTKDENDASEAQSQFFWFFLSGILFMVIISFIILVGISEFEFNEALQRLGLNTVIFWFFTVIVIGNFIFRYRKFNEVYIPPTYRSICVKCDHEEEDHTINTSLPELYIAKCENCDETCYNFNIYDDESKQKTFRKELVSGHEIK